MRHGDKIKNLGRKKAHREALLSNLASQLITHKRITTTLAKAKALRVYAEPLITKAKENTTHQRRVVFSYLQDKDAVTILFREIAEKIANRPGGYTRIVKLENRLGDNAEMAIIELVDYNTVYGADTAAAAKKSTRRRGGSTAKAKTAAPAAAKEVAPVEEAKVVEEVKTEAPVAEVTETPAAEAPATPEAEENAEKGE